MTGIDHDALRDAAEIALSDAFPHPGGGYSLSGVAVEDAVAAASAPYLDALQAAEKEWDRWHGAAILSAATEGNARDALAAAEARAERAENSFGGSRAIAMGIDDALREMGGELRGCTPWMLVPFIQKRIAHDRMLDND